MQDLNAKEFSLKCNCHCNKFVFSYYIDDPDCIYVSLWANKWYESQYGLFSRLWNRIKLAFKVICNGDYFINEIVVSKSDVIKFHNFIEDFKNNLVKE